MRGDPDSCGVWAPCLSHDGEQFCLIYTDVKRKDGSFKDAHNYIVTAPTIEGPWSDPVYMNSSGFDPSLFHDEDGRKWFVNMLWDHRARPLLFAGIALQEYDPKQRQARRPGQEHLPGHRPEAGRGPASLQAQRRLVLSADRRGRHRLRPRLHLRPLAQHRRAIRDPSATSTSSPPRTRRSTRCSAPAMATSSRRRTARPTSSI